MNARVENPGPGQPKEINQVLASNLILRRQAEATITDGRNILAIRLLDPEHTRDVRKRTERGYDKEARTGKITRKEAKRVPFVGDVKKLGI